MILLFAPAIVAFLLMFILFAPEAMFGERWK
jgi:hypothetical protein